MMSMPLKIFHRYILSTQFMGLRLTGFALFVSVVILKSSFRFHSNLSWIGSCFRPQKYLYPFYLPTKSIAFASPQNQRTSNKHIQQRQWDEGFPSQAHQLVVSKARNGPTYPHEKKYEE